jgi:hypothetical protein
LIDDGDMDGGVFGDFKGGLAVFGREYIKPFDFGAFGGGIARNLGLSSTSRMFSFFVFMFTYLFV